MTEKVSKYIDVFSLNKKTDIGPAADAFMSGKIILFRVGPVYSIILNPNITGLIDKLNVLKGRQKEQLMSVVCTYEQAGKIVDKNRVNEDFFRLTASFCSRAIIRMPVDTAIALPFPCNSEEGSLQFLSFEKTNPLRSAFMDEIAARGCQYIAITSCNISDAPTIEDLEPAKDLALLLNLKASFLGMRDIQTVVADIPEDKGAHKGSYVILSFCNPNAIEVKRLVNKTDREMTERFLKELFAEVKTETPLVYAL